MINKIIYIWEWKQYLTLGIEEKLEIDNKYMGSILYSDGESLQAKEESNKQATFSLQN